MCVELADRAVRRSQDEIIGRGQMMTRETSSDVADIAEWLKLIKKSLMLFTKSRIFISVWAALEGKGGLVQIFFAKKGMWVL